MAAAMSGWLNEASVSPMSCSERAGDVVVVAIGSVRARRRLQRVREPVDLEPAVVAVEETKVVHDPVGEPGVEGQLGAS